MPTLELNGKPFAEQTGTGEPVLKGNINFEGPIRINNQEVLSANGSIRLTVDEISEKTQGGGITLSHSLKNSSGAEIINSSGSIGSAVDFTNIANNAISGDKIHGGTISGSLLHTDVTFADVNSSIANDSISGDKIHGGTISNFKSTGISDESTEQRWKFNDTHILPIGSNSTGLGDDVHWIRYINSSPSPLHRTKIVAKDTRTSMWRIYSGSLNSNFIVSYAITYGNYVFGGMWQMNVSHASKFSIHGMENSNYGSAYIGVSYDGYGNCVLSFTPNSGDNSQGTLSSTIQCYGNCLAEPYDDTPTLFTNDYNTYWS